ncbi:hypothetical protein C8R46DRAFT_628207 [Mycena filopes]|nr:hypothetical protein C8R46DRAFT_628207 [Mycena filopes]
MHGFSATNVGKNRLTLKPPSNVGVFKKGKASFKAKVNSKPKGHKIRHFSELGFLNNTKKAAEKDASMSSSESSATSAQEIPASKKKAPTREARQTPAVARPASDLSKNPDSDIWDMESRASEKKRLRKQKLRSVEETSAIHVHGTVIVDARMPAWSERVAKAANVDPAETPDPVIPSSPSLGPSQSASQFKPLPVQAASRYFPSAEQTPAKRSTPPPLPVKSVSSIEAEHEPLQSDQDLEPQPQHTLVPPTCFAVPTRNRVLANQFPSVQAVPQDCILYPSAMIQVVLPEDPNHYAPSLQTSQSDFYPDELSMPQYSEEEEASRCHYSARLLRRRELEYHGHRCF